MFECVLFIQYICQNDGLIIDVNFIHLFMILKSDTAKQVADFLLQIKAIKLNCENPFTWASGIQSPIYCDNRIVLSYPKIRRFLAQQMGEQIKELYPDTEVIAGVATGAIGMGLLVAEYLELPFVYIRPEPKKHGRQNQIEGKVEQGQKVMVIEDLISTGMSSLKAIKALQSSKVEVLAMMSIFTYALDISEKAFKEENVTLYSLSDYPHLIKQARQENYISEEELNTLKKWRENPSAWKA